MTQFPEVIPGNLYDELQVEIKKAKTTNKINKSCCDEGCGQECILELLQK